MTKGILFDLDGVITDSAEYHYRAWREIAESAGISIDRAFNDRLRGVGRMKALELILHSGGKDDAYTDEEKANMAIEKNRRYRELIKQITAKDILPGISELLQNLREEKIRIALASASHSAFIIIGQLGLAPYFDYIADAADVEKTKPAPDIFLDACKGLSLSPHEVVGVEDSQVGIDALRDGKIFSIGIGVKGDITLSSTKELTIDLIRSIAL